MATVALIALALCAAALCFAAAAVAQGGEGSALARIVGVVAAGAGLAVAAAAAPPLVPLDELPADAWCVFVAVVLRLRLVLVAW